MAKRWVRKSYQRVGQVMLYHMERFPGTFHGPVYLAACLSSCKDVPGGIAYTQAVDKAVVQLYELVYPGDDMEFESLKLLCSQHRGIAEGYLPSVRIPI